MEHAQCRKVFDRGEFVNPDKGGDAEKSDVIAKVTLSRARPGELKVFLRMLSRSSFS